MPLEAVAMANFTLPNPNDLIRRAVRPEPPLPTPSQTDVIARVVRTDVPLPDTVTEEELRLHAAEVELRQLRAEVKALRGAIKTTARVCQRQRPVMAV
jgi:hypothetical protein